MNIPTPATQQAHQHAVAARMERVLDLVRDIDADAYVATMTIQSLVGQLQDAVDDFAQWVSAEGTDSLAGLESTLIIRLDDAQRAKLARGE